MRKKQVFTSALFSVALTASALLPSSALASGSRYTSVTEEGETLSWAVTAVNAPLVWEKGWTGKGVKVAVIDTGISAHSDLEVKGGTSFIDGVSSYADDHSHGTHIAGIIGAKRNGSGMAGIAPDVDLYAVKVLDSSNSGKNLHTVRAILWAIQNDMDIINLSSGSETYSHTIEAAITKAVEAGIIVVTSANNDGNAEGTDDSIMYPGKFDEVVTVGAVDSSLKRAYFSSTGPTLDFVAPGVFIQSTFNKNNDYIFKSGTSMSAPVITGMFAILKEAFPEKTSIELQELLRKASIDLGVAGKDNQYGYGMPDFKNLMDYFPSTMDNALLDAAKQGVEDAERYPSLEIILAVKNMIAALPASLEKSELSNRLQKIEEAFNKPNVDPSLLKQATSSVEFAEKHNYKLYRDRAWTSINRLPVSEERSALEERMKPLMPDPVKEVETQLQIVERSKSTTALNIVKKAINALPASAEKDNLIERVQLLEENLMATQLLEKAKDAVTSAEAKPSSESIESAKSAINSLKESEEKAALAVRIQAVEAAYNTPVETKPVIDPELLNQAIKSVETAEKHNYKLYRDRAWLAIEKLPVSEERSALEQRMESFSPSAVEEVEVQLQVAEKNKSDSVLRLTKSAILSLPDSPEKDAFLIRVQKLEETIAKEKALLKEAETLVIHAEQNPSVKSFVAARNALASLPDSDHKAKLASRVQAAETAFNTLVGTKPVIDPALLAAATKAVVLAEKVNYRFTRNEAIIASALLPESLERGNLKERIQVLIPNTEIEVTAIVDLAKRLNNPFSTKIAVEQVNSLPDSTIKQDLLNRLHQLSSYPKE